MAGKFSTVLGGVSVLAMCSPALAQAVPPQSTLQVADSVEDTGVVGDGDIIVSARRREESVQDVPQTVNVVTSAQIEKLNIRNFSEVSAVIPGLTLTQGSSSGSSATVRGVAFSPNASGSNPTIEFYLNDAPLSSNFIFQSMFDIGQIEIQRGPQGTLRGRASPSGSIVFATRRPDLSQPGLVVNGTVTDTHAHRLDVTFNVPMIKDILAFRLAGLFDESQNDQVFTIKRRTQSEFNPDPLRHTQAIRASILFEPAQWLTANLMYQKLHTRQISYQHVQSRCLVTGAACPASSLLIRPFDRRSVDDQGSGFTQHHDVFVANLDFRFGGQKLSYVGMINKQDYNAFAPSDLGDYFNASRFAIGSRALSDPIGFEPVCANQNDLVRLRPTNGEFYQCTHRISKRTSHELRLSSTERVGGIFDYVIGAFYDQTDLDGSLLDFNRETPVVSGSSINVSSTAISRTGGQAKEKSVFGNLTARLSERFELSGGLRYIDYQATPSVTVITTPPGSPSRNTAPEVDESKLIYTASAKYNVTPDIMVYATVGSSYRPGPRAIGNFSVGSTGQGLSAREQQFTNLPPETSTSYEVGAKLSFMNGRGRLNLSAFRQEFDNFVYRGPGVFYRNFEVSGTTIRPVVGSFNFISAVPVRVEGFEVESSFRILDRWTIGVNASYANGRIRNGTVACTDFDRNGVPDVNPQTPANAAALAALLPAGENLAVCSNYNARASFTPKFSANVQSEYSVSLSRGADGFVRGLFNFSGENSADPNNRFDNVGAFGLLNLYVGLRDPDGAWEITAFAKNILRERKIMSTTSDALSTTVRTLQFGPNGNPVGSLTTNFAGDYVPVSVTAPREFGITARIAIGSR